MRHKKFILILFVVFCMVATTKLEAQTMNLSVRPPAVAGTFYPAHPELLKIAITDFMKDARPKQISNPLAIIVPHAGYVFSGQICADAFKQVADNKYDVIVVLGTNHTRGGWRKNGLYRGLGFQTPLGMVEIDLTVSDEIIKIDPNSVYDNDIHAREHSIEVTLPFIKTIFPNAKIVPIVVGSPDIALNEQLGVAIAKALKGKRALIVASTDLSHYPSYDDANKIDHETINAVLSLDVSTAHQKIEKLMTQGTKEMNTCACGEATVLTAISASKKMGAKSAKMISYANSGDSVFADRSRVVGYTAIVISADESVVENKVIAKTTEENISQIPNEKEKHQMLKLARESITRYLGSMSVPLPRDCEPYLTKRRGVFVTLKKNGALRGCIGNTNPDLSLCQLIPRIALSSSLEDRRFPPVSFGELKDIAIEISVLTPPQAVASIDEIKMGRDGIIINKNGKSALFLPQVAEGAGWTKEIWLSQLSLKAGLPADAWKADAKFFTFQAIVFEEEKHQ
ncbi:MAG: AmmeMemoRadiSam system protein B [Deltaproteobacteria bacterium]